MKSDQYSPTQIPISSLDAVDSNSLQKLEILSSPRKRSPKRNSRSRNSCSKNDSVQCPKNEKGAVSHVFYLFCTTSTIRGIGKIHHGPLFLRFLWISFIVIMTSGLIIATTFIVLEYLQYDVNVITKIIMDNNSSFPAITICHHHPFSTRAYQLWKSNQVISPSKYNKMIRNISITHFEKNDRQSAIFGTYLDTISMYYQNLHLNDSKELGHNKETFLMCVSQLQLNIQFEDDCSNMRHINFSHLSNDEYFNCHTFEPKSVHDSYLLDSLNIVASLEPLPDYKDSEQAFLADTFQRSQGLRVIVHEIGSFPDIAKDGLHVEPGKMNEIKFQPVQHLKLNSPPKPCVLPKQETYYEDLERKYKMDKEQCMKSKKQEKIMKNCRCIFVSFPRLIKPSKEIPYCGEIPGDKNLTVLMTRTTCIMEILEDRAYQEYLEKEECFPRCETMKYEGTVSVTKWGATGWHLHWVRITNQAITKLENPENDSIPITSDPDYKSWLKYGIKENLSDVVSENRTHFLKGDNFAYVVLQRKTKNTIIKQEKLVTTMYVLMSRFGGVCSLTIGLTAGFIVELIEFLYKYVISYSEQKKKRKSYGGGIGKGVSSLRKDTQHSKLSNDPWKRHHKMSTKYSTFCQRCLTLKTKQHSGNSTETEHVSKSPEEVLL